MRWSKQGFTLIEVMITLAIMAVLTVLTAQSVQQAVKAKVKIQDQIDSVSQVRDVQRLIEKDIEAGFHYRDIEKEMAEAVQKARIEAKKEALKKKTAPATGESGEVPATDNVPVQDSSIASEGPYPPYFKMENRVSPETHFQGTSSEINLVTSNVVRTQKDMPLADYAEVGYFLDSCRASGPGEGKCLFRRFSPLVDKDVTRGGYKSQLLRNVTELSFRYFSKEKKDWTDSWKSFEGGESTALNKFPEAVEFTLTVEQPANPGIKNAKGKTVSVQVVIPIKNPNNPEPKTTANESGEGNTDAQNPQE